VCERVHDADGMGGHVDLIGYCMRKETDGQMEAPGRDVLTFGGSVPKNKWREQHARAQVLAPAAPPQPSPSTHSVTHSRTHTPESALQRTTAAT